ncbi:hypothetical protein [Sinomicrobium oceani]|uniref:hypothetical protein n=1 Tax=Sinomicrobium oceani TaxID=1150368 RepID=UPI00227D281C|nr:hypothetical protein [Sinomicrobium oceani]
MRNIFKKISAYVPSPWERVRVGVLFLLLPFTFYAQTNTFPASGNVGIGITNPTMKLTVDGTIRNNSFSLSGSNGDFYMKRGNSDANWKRALVCWDTSLTLNFDGDFSNGVRVMGNKFSVDGNMGIGTDNAAGWKLAVNGKIRAKEIKVETGWSDFVFEDSYHLPTLEEVEQHIKEKGHLKDIPSAKEVEENGIFLGEMDAKLLQKIEELTLYTIQQEKQLHDQEKLIITQQKQIEGILEENQQFRKEIDELKKP